MQKNNTGKTEKNVNGDIIIKSRKYNQLHFLKSLVLNNLDDLTFKEGCYYFEEDAKKIISRKLLKDEIIICTDYIEIFSKMKQ